MIIVEARDLTRRFGTFTAVDRISFSVAAGEIFGFLGPNGAGKSTTIRMLCGILAPTAGTAIVAGHDVSRTPDKVKAEIGYMSQKFSLYEDLTIRENVAFYAGIYGLERSRLKTRVEKILDLVDLGGKQALLAAELPAGWRQRLALACALVHGPRILFLDEPTAGVDPVARRDFWARIEALAGAGTTVLVTTHYMDEAEYCNGILFINNGRIAAVGTPTALRRECGVDSLEEAFIRFAAPADRGGVA